VIETRLPQVLGRDPRDFITYLNVSLAVRDVRSFGIGPHPFKKDKNDFKGGTFLSQEKSESFGLIGALIGTAKQMVLLWMLIVSASWPRQQCEAHPFILLRKEFTDIFKASVGGVYCLV